MNEHLSRLAQTEIDKHHEEAARLRDAADRLVTAAEFHDRQAEGWTSYLGEIATRDGGTARPQLTVIEGGAS